ncbi:hypothetical protein WJX74_004384 [Apatococcus lobatus]|uniref:carbonic anhydrase n=1 Tax=Apatococcus lobatus TaxID=904363 RepID=A0AAW1SEJ1_9CHLO
MVSAAYSGGHCPSSSNELRLAGRPSLRSLRQVVHCQTSKQEEPSPLQTRQELLVAKSRRQLLVSGAATAACWCCRQAVAGAAEEEETSSGWAYDRLADWPRTCQPSSLQSPIDIPLHSQPQPRDPSTMRNVRFDYKDGLGPVNVVNPGHGTMHVKIPPGSRCYVGQQELELQQYHFHAPSEHAVNGQRVAMEMHLVHRDVRSGGLAVLAVLLEAGRVSKAHPALQFALEQAHLRDGEVSATIQSPQNLSLTSLIPGSSPDSAAAAGSIAQTRAPASILHYTGSLTTPPCSELVCWYVFMQRTAIADWQVERFQQFIQQTTGMRSNARALQPSDDRLLDWLKY